MNKELAEILLAVYQDAKVAQEQDEAESYQAKEDGDMGWYYDLTIYIELADSCWALEKWEEAKQWYRHNARMTLEKRAWLSSNAPASYPFDATIHWEAATFTKAGELQLAREHIKKAIDHLVNTGRDQLALAGLALHAAQLDLPELSTHIREVIDARLELPGNTDLAITQARQQLHYEPAQVSLLLGKWEEFEKQTASFATAAQQVQNRPNEAFPEPLQAALVNASLGLSTLSALRAGTIDPETGRTTAHKAFENAMVGFYQFSGYLDVNTYFMRLNTRFADELALGKAINPNPFADE